MDELCSTPFPFRFMTGFWLVAPCSLPTTLHSSLSPPGGCARNRWLACSRNCDLYLVLSVRELVHNRSTYLSFVSQQSTFETPLPPPFSFLPAPSILFLCILRRRKKKLVLCCAVLVVVGARVVALAHTFGEWDFKAENVVERERSRASLKTR
jgi:hypothetical protein